MPLPVVRSPLGLPLGGPGLLPGPPALPGCWPEAYIIQYCGSFSDVLTSLDTYTSGALGGMAPPLGSIMVTSSRREGMASLHGTTTGGPPLGSYILQIGSAAVGVTGGRNPGGLPLFQLHPSYSDRPPHVGFPAWGARGGLPLFQKLFVFIPKFTRHTSPATWGASPSFRIVYAAGRGWRPSALSRAQEQLRGGLPLFHSNSWGARRRGCRQVPLPRRSEHRSVRRWPLPPPRCCLPFIPPPPSSGPGIPPGAAGRVAVRPDVTVAPHCIAGQDR